MANNTPPRPAQRAPELNNSRNALHEIVKRLVAWGLPQDDVEFTLRGAVSQRELDPRDHLFSQDTPVDAVYLLESGQIYQERISPDAQGRRRVTLRRETLPGEWIGHYDLLYTQQYSARARATEFSRVIVVQAAALNRLLYRYPKLRQRIAPMDKIGRLRTMPLFGSLDLTVLSYIADACRVEKIPPQTHIYEANQPADHIFIVDTGQVVLSGQTTMGQTTRGQTKGQNNPDTWLGNGMAFGFSPHLSPQSAARAAEPTFYGHTAITTVASTVYVIARRHLLELADLDPQNAGNDLRYLAETTLAGLPVFTDYTAAERRSLLGYMSHYFVPTHHLIVQQGEWGDSLWVLLPGSRAILHALESGQALQPTQINGPNFFGELALRVEHTFNSTVQAEPHSQWLRLHTDDFHTFLRDHDPDGNRQLLERLTLSPAAERYLGKADERQRYTLLQKGENLVIFQRRHWLAFLRRLLPSLVISGGVTFAWVLLAAQGWLPDWVFWIFGLLGLLSLLLFIWGLIDYLNDYILVTNQRVVRQEKVLLVTEWRQAAFLEQVRNVDIASSFFGNVFQYGELSIQTAASSGTISFDYVPNPNGIKQTILEQQNLRQQHYQASSRMVIQNLLEERFGLRLRLPARVRPEISAPKVELQNDLWQRVRRALDIDSHLKIRLDDKIIWRKHWFILLTRTFPSLSGLAIIFALLIGQQMLPPEIRAFVLPLDIVLVLFGLALCGWLAWIVADWRNDTYEIDNKQIADVEKKPLFFAENRRTANLGEIENIEVRIPSPLHYLLNFGNVRLQTAAAQGEFSFDWVPDPRGVAEEVRHRIEAYRNQQELNRAKQRAQELPDWFEMYNRLGADRDLLPGGDEG